MKKSMVTYLKHIFPMIFAVVFIIAASDCQSQEGIIDQAGKKIDEGVAAVKDTATKPEEKAGEAKDTAVKAEEKAGMDKMEEGKSKMEEGMGKMQEGMDKMKSPMDMGK